jgi:hypothetical protein
MPRPIFITLNPFHPTFLDAAPSALFPLYVPRLTSPPCLRSRRIKGTCCTIGNRIAGSEFLRDRMAYVELEGGDADGGDGEIVQAVHERSSGG